MAQKNNRGLIPIIRQLLHLVAGPDSAPVEVTRAIDRWTFDESIRNQLNENGYRVSDVFMEGTDQFAIAYKVEGIDEYGYPEINRTELYQFAITNDGVNVTLGEPIQVKQVFTAIQTTPDVMRGLTIYRDTSGVVHGMAIASTSVLNRDRQIDSTALHQSMIDNSKVHGLPFITLYHMGKKRQIGKATGVTRHGPLYIAALEFENHELAEHVIRAIEKEPDYYGISIGFLPTAPPKIERIGNERIPIYTEGINEEISILPEHRACSWYTNIRIERTMTEEIDKFMARIFPNNPDLQKKYGDGVERLATEIGTSGAIQRAATATPEATPAAAVTPATTTEVAAATQPAKPTDPVQYELTPDAVQAIATLIANSDQFKVIGDNVARTTEGAVGLATEVKRLSDSLAELTTQNADLVTQNRALADRVAALELPEVEKQRAWGNEQPRNSQNRVMIGLAPSQTRSAELPDKSIVKLPAVAGNTFSGMEFATHATD